jgi:hypothetical protein
MRVACHIVRKDLYRLRWILLLWIVIMAGSITVATLQTGLDHETYFPFYVAAFMFASVLVPLIGFGLVMGLVHDDPVADIDAFWITRPVSNRQLLAAKSIALGLLWLLPVVISIPLWLRHGYNVNQLGQAAWQTLQLQMIMAALAVPLAVLAPSGSKFVMNILLAGAGLLLLALISGLGGPREGGPISEGLMRTRGWVIVSIWLVTSGVVVVSQFFGRRTRRSWAIMVVAAIAGFAVVKWWPWEIRDALPPAETRPASNLGLEFRSATLTPVESPTAIGERFIRVAYNVTGLGNGSIALLRAVSHRLQWPDDAVAGTSSVASADELAAAAWDVALGRPVESSAQSQFGVLAKAYGERLLRERPSYSAVVDGEIRRLEIVAEVPMQTGRKSVRNGVMVRVGEFLLDPNTGVFQVAIGESAPNFSLIYPKAIFGSRPAAADREYFFLLNRADGRSLPGQAGKVGETFDVASLRYSHSVLSFRPGGGWKGGSPPHFSAWVREAILVKVLAREAGSFHRTIAPTRFELNNSVTADVRQPGGSPP